MQQVTVDYEPKTAKAALGAYSSANIREHITGDPLSDSKSIMSLLRAFEAEALEHASDMTAADRVGRTVLRDSILQLLSGDIAAEDAPTFSEHSLLASLQLRAQQELVSEKELLVVEQAAKLARAFAGMARQSSEIESARLLSAEREDFIATLTHDLKNPLIGANRLLVLIAEGKIAEVDSKVVDLLQQIIASNSHSLRLLQNLNDIYRYESAPGQMHLQNCQFIPIIQAAFDEIKAFSSPGKIEATLSITSQVDTIPLDPIAIRRLLDNLFGNALKFTAAGGRLDVRVFDDQTNVIIEVEDDGVGIDESERHLLFQRFSQCTEGKKRYGGSGLGLYLCKQIADAHKAKIEALSSGKGALFRVSLPQS